MVGPMRSDYVLFEAPRLRRTTRCHMCRLNATFWAVVLATIGAAMMSPSLFASSPVVVGSALGALVLIAGGVSVKHYLLSRTIWCVRVNDDHIISYDCTRRKTVWTWAAIRQVDLTTNALQIAQSRYRAVSLTTQFDDFTTLGHLIWHNADQHGIPFTIEGQSLDEIHVQSLCPAIVSLPPTVPPDPSS